MTVPTYALWDAIQEAKDSSVYPKGAEFWPEGSLRRIITKNHISTELYPYTAERPLSYVENELIRFIQQNGTKLLAICLMCRIRGAELEQAMHEFRGYGLNDQSLPVSQGVLTQRLRWDNGPDVNNFLQHQWKFVAPKFSMGRCLPMLGLLEGTILPFIQLWTVAKGNFGTVYKVKVHSSHFDREDPIHQVRYKLSSSSVYVCLLFAPRPLPILFVELFPRPNPQKYLIPELTLIRKTAMSLLRRSPSWAENTRTWKMPSLAVNEALCWT